MPVWSIIATSTSWANPLVLDLLVARAQKIELLPGVGRLHAPSPPHAFPSKCSNVWESCRGSGLAAGFADGRATGEERPYCRVSLRLYVARLSARFRGGAVLLGVALCSLFTRVRAIGILRSSGVGGSQKFA